MVVDNKTYPFEEGDLFFAFPNQIHSFVQHTPSLKYMICFSPDLFTEVKELFQSKIPDCPVITNTLLQARIPDVRSRLQKIVSCDASGTTFDKLIAKGQFLVLLGEILPLMTFIQSKGSLDSTKTILSYCLENYTQPITLDLLAKELHLNKCYISHIFKERMNICFTDFITMLRIEHACSLLENGDNITETAFSSGFSSIRTFNRVFVENMEMTPREYMKLAKSDQATAAKQSYRDRKRVEISSF